LKSGEKNVFFFLLAGENKIIQQATVDTFCRPTKRNRRSTIFPFDQNKASKRVRPKDKKMISVSLFTIPKKLTKNLT